MKKYKCLIAILIPTFFSFAPIAYGESFPQKKEEIEVVPIEDLMREHGVLDRLLLIYEEIDTRLTNNVKFPPYLLKDAVLLMKSFIQNYHEKEEEEYIFPRFEQHGVMLDLIAILKKQHQQGREITEYLLSQVKDDMLASQEACASVHNALQDFIVMYRPHAAREDTVLFPLFKTLITQDEYKELGEIFEEKEHQLFGEDGFDKVVNAVAEIEKKLGIFNLSKFTPQF